MFDQIPVLMAVGAAIIGGLYLGKAVRLVGLPSLIGYMFFGVIMGASILGVFNEQAVSSLQFITDIALAMIALIIGSELNLKALARLGKGIIFVILSESLFAFILVTASLYLLTKDFALSIVFGALAPASAPAGTVAVIQENNARGNLTKALYAVVGFDDGLAIIIFGLSSAVAEKMLIAENS
ncbi:MAG: cation:proton antiporter, partial [Candidatus Fermentibacteraceae bacterium]|nr:cation:proton antiporter [Candidatus Fermentibacteraceae bacterium]